MVIPLDTSSVGGKKKGHKVPFDNFSRPESVQTKEWDLPAGRKTSLSWSNVSTIQPSPWDKDRFVMKSAVFSLCYRCDGRYQSLNGIRTSSVGERYVWKRITRTNAMRALRNVANRLEPTVTQEVFPDWTDANLSLMDWCLKYFKIVHFMIFFILLNRIFRNLRRIEIQ